MFFLVSKNFPLTAITDLTILFWLTEYNYCKRTVEYPFKYLMSYNRCPRSSSNHLCSRDREYSMSIDCVVILLRVKLPKRFCISNRDYMIHKLAENRSILA